MTDTILEVKSLRKRFGVPFGICKLYYGNDSRFRNFFIDVVQKNTSFLMSVSCSV